MNTPRALRGVLPAAAALLLALAVVATAAHAYFSTATTATATASTIAVGDPASVSASSGDACATVTVGWTRAQGADSYRVQYQEGSAGWIDLEVETPDTTSTVDTTGHAGTTVAYRVYGRNARSDWEGAAPAVSAPLSCP